MDLYLQTQQMSEWLLLNANSSAICELYHYNFQWDEDEVRFVLDQQQSAGRHVALNWLINLIPSQLVFALIP
jgi:hypothetical protein